MLRHTVVQYHHARTLSKIPSDDYPWASPFRAHLYLSIAQLPYSGDYGQHLDLEAGPWPWVLSFIRPTKNLLVVFIEIFLNICPTVLCDHSINLTLALGGGHNATLTLLLRAQCPIWIDQVSLTVRILLVLIVNK